MSNCFLCHLPPPHLMFFFWSSFSHISLNLLFSHSSHSFTQNALTILNYVLLRCLQMTSTPVRSLKTLLAILSRKKCLSTLPNHSHFHSLHSSIISRLHHPIYILIAYHTLTHVYIVYLKVSGRALCRKVYQTIV